MHKNGSLAKWATDYYSKSAEYAQRLASKWNSEWLTTFSPYVQAMQRAAGREGVAIDVGCGGGQTTYLISSDVRTAIGLDLSVASLSSRPPQPVNVGFIRGDTQRLPFADDSADVVGCYATLEHLPDAEQALAELLRVARPGGWLVVYGPNMISPLRPISLMVRGLKQRRWHPDASPTFLIKALLWNVQKLLGLRKGFLYRRPLVDDLSFPGSDYDAICLVSNFDLRDFARRRHLTVRQLGQGTSRVGRAVAAWFPAVAGGVGLIAQKPPAAR